MLISESTHKRQALTDLTTELRLTHTSNQVLQPQELCVEVLRMLGYGLLLLSRAEPEELLVCCSRHRLLFPEPGKIPPSWLTQGAII